MNGLQLIGLFTACGAGVGLIFDFLRALRKAAGAGKILTGVSDVLFWAAAVCCVWICMLRFYDGRVRLFEFIAIGCGCFLYFMTISKAALSCFYAVFENIFKFIKFIFKILLTPARFLYKIISVYCAKLYAYIRKSRRKCGHEQDNKKN